MPSFWLVSNRMKQRVQTCFQFMLVWCSLCLSISVGVNLPRSIPHVSQGCWWTAGFVTLFPLESEGNIKRRLIHNLKALLSFYLCNKFFHCTQIPSQFKITLRHWLDLQTTEATPPIDCLACPCSEFLLQCLTVSLNSHSKSGTLDILLWNDLSQKCKQ